MVCISVGSSTTAFAQGAKPKIAVFSGPTATVQHDQTLMTSNKARAKYGLPLLKDGDGSPLRFDALRPQKLAAPVTVYVEAYSAHPTEKDVQELYASPDGYLDAKTRAFSKQRKAPDDVPVYEVTLDPSDGLYPLPYMARQADGSAWDSDCAYRGAPTDKCRVMFYPDASRSFEEIDRFGLGGPFGNDQLSSKADFDFYRAAPAAGYRKGLPASERTDKGKGDIPPEVWGVDFYPYGDGDGLQRDPAMPTLAKLTNIVQHAMSSGTYAGAIWLEGSPTTEETTYWLNLLIDTIVPISGNASQKPHQAAGNDGDTNIIDSVQYILSGIWKDENGKDKVGGVMIQNQIVFSSRVVQKGDARAGGYVVTGGHGGIVASMDPAVLTFVPDRKHTWTSEVNMTRLPSAVPGVSKTGSQIATVQVSIKDSKGDLLPTAIPKVTIVNYSSYSADGYPENDPAPEVEILARIDKNLSSFPLSGFVLQGSEPYGAANAPTSLALNRAALRGMPIVHVGRGNNEGFVGGGPTMTKLQINGGNLTATKARLLLMASIMKFGSLPVPADPDHPTKDEKDAIIAKLKLYQEVFDTH
jgi:L-asparaginase